VKKRVSAAALLSLLTVLGTAGDARAQFGQMQPPPGKSAPKKDPNVPETHAAPGSGDETIPKTTTGEPQLPDNPLEVDEITKKRIGTSAEAGDGHPDAPKTTYTVAPPYFAQRSKDYEFKTVFPFWLQRKLPGDTVTHAGLVYHRRRSEKRDADVVFPFFWRWREDKDFTTVVGPVAHHSGPKGTDTVVAPLVFYGTRKDGSYLYIPPLLTFLKNDKHGGSNIVGPGFCFWKGGQTCNPETADSIDYGLFPFFFAGKNEQTRYEVAPPLLHYYRYTELDQSWLNVWGPVVRAHWENLEAFHIAPIYFHLWGKNRDHLTVLPFFHKGHDGNKKLLVTPFFLTKTGEKGEKTFVTWGYAHHKGRTELEMITPFYWYHHDPDIGQTKRMVLPFYYRNTGPRDNDFALFPFYGHFRRYGIRDTTFVTPFIQHTTSITGWETNIHPLVYIGRDRQHSHTVVAPFFWDFVTPSSRTTIGFPFYWRIADKTSTTQVVLNTYYTEKKLRNGSDWTFHVLPIFSYGETPNGHHWDVLFGLAGYKRRGAETTMKLFWVPVKLSEDARLGAVGRIRGIWRFACSE
jgi:hypothetical protein